jgi:hypothetical protein
MYSYNGVKFLIEFFNDGALIMRVLDKKTIELNATGKEILKRVIAREPQSQIIDALVSLYSVDSCTVEKDVSAYVEQLDTLGILAQLDSADNQIGFQLHSLEDCESISL